MSIRIRPPRDPNMLAFDGEGIVTLNVCIQSPFIFRGPDVSLLLKMQGVAVR